MRILAALLLLLRADDGLSLEEFEKLHRDLQPVRDEAWRTVPWKISLLEARDLAIRERKPIFIWSMDGNPLGCG
jgi:hypothetical protein